MHFRMAVFVTEQRNASAISSGLFRWLSVHARFNGSQMRLLRLQKDELDRKLFLALSETSGVWILFRLIAIHSCPFPENPFETIENSLLLLSKQSQECNIALHEVLAQIEVPFFPNKNFFLMLCLSRQQGLWKRVRGESYCPEQERMRIFVGSRKKPA